MYPFPFWKILQYNSSKNHGQQATTRGVDLIIPLKVDLGANLIVLTLNTLI